MKPENYILNVKPSNPKGEDWVLKNIPLESDSIISKLVQRTFSASPPEFSRKLLTTRPFNQGSIGSCVGCSGKVVVQDNSRYRNLLDLSAMWIYKRGKHYDEWEGEAYSGTSVSGACEALRKDGVCLENFFPYNKTSDQVIPLDGAFEDATGRKIKAYYYLPISDEQIENIKRVLNLKSLWTSFTVHKQFYEIGADGILKSDGYRESAKMGGHAVALTGYKYINGKLYWECQNSWGEEWGDKGFCYIEHDLLKRIAISGAYYLELFDDENSVSGEVKDPRTTWQKIIQSLWFKIGVPVGGFGILILILLLFSSGD